MFPLCRWNIYIAEDLHLGSCSVCVPGWYCKLLRHYTQLFQVTVFYPGHLKQLFHSKYKCFHIDKQETTRRRIKAPTRVGIEQKRTKEREKTRQSVMDKRYKVSWKVMNILIIFVHRKWSQTFCKNPLLPLCALIHSLTFATTNSLSWWGQLSAGAASRAQCRVSSCGCRQIKASDGLSTTQSIWNTNNRLYYL